METGSFVTHDRDGREVMNIAAMIEQRALLQPAAPALIMRETVISYRGLQSAVNAVAAKLLAGGIEAGQMVGISMGQTPMHMFATLALARIGAPFVTIHPALPRERRMLAVRRYGVTAIVSGRPDCELDGLPFVLLQRGELQGEIAPVPYAPTSFDTPLRIAQSSGTSGDPKGVMLSHGHTRARLDLTSYGMTPTSRVLLMDLNFVASFNYALCALAMGAAIVFVAAESPDDTIDAVRRFGVTDWLLSPAIARGIATRLIEHDVYFGTLNHLRIVGASPNAKLVDTMMRRFSPNLFVVYGLTEMGTVAIATPAMLRRHPASTGTLLPTIDAEVVDEHDNPLPAGQSGILRLRAEVMLRGYYPDDGLTTERFRDGWYYPRDMAHVNEEGLLFIEGRQDDVLNIGGVKVQLRDIEQVLEAHPAIREAAVFVVIDAAGREKMGLAYVAGGGTPIAELDAYARDKLGPLRPQEYIAVRELPRTMTGKVQRDRLTTAYLDGALA